MEFLEGGLLKLMSNVFKSGVLRMISNIAEEYTFYGKLKKRIPSQVYFKDFVHRYRTVF